VELVSGAAQFIKEIAGKMGKQINFRGQGRPKKANK
jgi:hypothetical protein